MAILESQAEYKIMQVLDVISRKNELSFRNPNSYMR